MQDKLNALYEARISPNLKIEHPPTLLSVIEQRGTSSVYIPIFSLGDLSLIQGKQKSKKTFFTSVLSAQILSNYSDKLFAYPPEDKSIAIFDTEQSLYYADKTNKRINHLSNASKEYYYFAFRDRTPIERKELIEHFLQEFGASVCFLLIDGIVDLLFDFNDLKECTNLVQWLMSMSKQYDVHISCILHENISDGKARGHIGTLLAQKVESVIRIEKNKKVPNRSTIKAKDTRGLQFSDFDIEIDFNGIPHLVDCEEATNQL